MKGNPIKRVAFLFLKLIIMDVFEFLDQLLEDKDILALYEIKDAIEKRISFLEGGELPIVSEL